MCLRNGKNESLGLFTRHKQVDPGPLWFRVENRARTWWTGDRTLHALKPTMLAQVTGAIRLDVETGITGNLQGILNQGASNMLDGEVAQESAKLQALQIKQQLSVQALAIANAGRYKIFELLS